VVECWCGYLSGARCRLAYGPADATATHCLLLQQKSRLVLPFWYRLTWVVPDNGPLNGWVCVCVCVCVPSRTAGSLSLTFSATKTTRRYHAASLWRQSPTSDTTVSQSLSLTLSSQIPPIRFIASVAEWLACWTQAQKVPGSNRSRDTVG